MRVIWDVSMLSVPPTGIGRYVRGSLVAAAGLRPAWSFTALSLSGLTESTRLHAHIGTLPPNVTRRHLRVKGAAILRRALNATPVPLLEPVAGGVADAFVDSEWLFPRQRRGLRIAVVHDLIPLRFPQWTTAATERLHRRKLPDVRRADRVICNSAATARDVEERLGVPASRLRVARPGVDDRYRTARPAGGPAGPYVATVATIEPRKNLGGALAAFAHARRALPELRLLLVGAEGWGDERLEARIAEHGLGDAVVRRGYLGPDDLPALVAGARAVLWPSFFEGFGMPVAEALAAGVPVVTSDDPSLDEAAGPAAWRAPAGDAEALGAALVAAVEDGPERERRIALGRAHAAGLTWEACARVFVEAIEEGGAR